MIANIKTIDKVSIAALGKGFFEEQGVTTIADLADKLNISLSSENRNRHVLAEKLAGNSFKPQKEYDAIPDYAKSIITELLNESYAMSGNSRRKSFAPWFKTLVTRVKDKYDVKYQELADLLGISSETLMGFKSQKIPEPKPIDELSNKIATIWNSTPPKNKKTIDAFCYFLSKKHESLEFGSYQNLRNILINLGFYSPRGPRIKNQGGVKKEFEPHAIWEGDGKQVNISINGLRYSFCWYAFTDQNTTLIVGSNIDKTETAENFLKGLRDAEERNNLYAVGVLIDNRLSDSDLSPINDFMEKHNITLIRTFPGNSKSNGNIENNFSIFERFVGDIEIEGKTSEQIAASIAENMVEVFTQLRNNQPRKRLDGATPEERAKNSKRPEHQKSQIEKIAQRFNTETLDIDEKWKLIKNARKYFEPLSEEAENKIKYQLKYYNEKTIVAAQATYIAQIFKRPEESFTSAYFMAILRNKQESKAKQIYNEEYRAGIKKLYSILPSSCIDEKECAEKILEELIEAQNKPSPTEKLLHLDALSWNLVRLSDSLSLTNLWQLVQDGVEKCFSISLKFWQQVNEYITDKIGKKLYKEHSPPALSNRSLSKTTTVF